jgi:hypothetical protein
LVPSGREPDGMVTLTELVEFVLEKVALALFLAVVFPILVSALGEIP